MYGQTAIAVSPNSQHIAICDDGYLMLMDGRTLSGVGGGMSFGNFSFPVYSPIITNDNHVFFIFNHGLNSYDPGSRTVVDEINRGGFVDVTSIRLSADENYMLANQTDGVRLLGLQNRMFTTDTNLGHIGWQGYFTTEANTMYLTDGQSIEIYQLSTLTKVGGSQLPQKNIAGFI